MKKSIGFTLLFGAASLLSPALNNAWGQESRFYIKGDLGGNVTPDLQLKEFFGPVADGSKVKLDPGFRAGIAGGYQLTDWFAPEAELGYLGNQIKDVTGATVVHEATFANVPVLLNAKFQLPNRSPLTPYVGAGVGFSTSILDVDQITLGNNSVHGSDAAVVFAYQAFGGLRYKINERMGLSVEYRFFVAESPTWKAEEFFGSLPPSDSIRFGQAQTHAVSLAFDFRF